MAEINVWTIVLIAFFTGLGSGIGNPIGQHLYEKYIKSKLVKTTEKLDDVPEKLKEELARSIENTKHIEEKILGKQVDNYMRNEYGK
jgi:hypothetical protein